MTETIAGRSLIGRRGELVFWLALVAAVAVAGSAVTAPNIPTWYATLAKPAFTPPNWLFGPAWTALYGLMAVAVWRARAAAGAARARVTALFVTQLALNAVWSPVFFGLHAPAAALAIIIALLVAVAATLVAFCRVERTAGLLLAPYLAWIGFAAALNAAIVALN